MRFGSVARGAELAGSYAIKVRGPRRRARDFGACGIDDALGLAFIRARTSRGIWIGAGKIAFIAQLFRRCRARIASATSGERVFFNLATIPGKRIAVPAFGFFVETRKPIVVLIRAAEVLRFFRRIFDVRYAVIVLGVGAALAIALDVADVRGRRATSSGEGKEAETERDPRQKGRKKPSPFCLVTSFFPEHVAVLPSRARAARAAAIRTPEHAIGERRAGLRVRKIVAGRGERAKSHAFVDTCAAG